MKKSMLLSTIAMIVVVVVALSTATFAWFSSQQASTIQGTMSIQAGRDILVSNYVYGDGASPSWTLTDSIPLTQSDVAPFAPKATVGTYVTHGANTAAAFAYKNDTKWFTATKDPGKKYASFNAMDLDAAENDPNKTTSALKVVATTFQIAKSNRDDEANIKVSIDFSTPGTSQYDLDAMRATKVVLVVTSYDAAGAMVSDSTVLYGTRYNYDGNNLTNTTGAALTNADGTEVIAGKVDETSTLTADATTVVGNISNTTAQENGEWKVTSAGSGFQLTAGLHRCITNTITYTSGYTYEITAFIWLDGFAAADAMAAKQVSVNIGIGLAA